MNKFPLDIQVKCIEILYFSTVLEKHLRTDSLSKESTGFVIQGSLIFDPWRGEISPCQLISDIASK